MSADKRLTTTTVIKMVHDAYDQLEIMSLHAAKTALKDKFGFGAKRWARFEAAYLDAFGEKAQSMSEDMKKQARKRWK